MIAGRVRKNFPNHLWPAGLSIDRLQNVAIEKTHLAQADSQTYKILTLNHATQITAHHTI